MSQHLPRYLSRRENLLKILIHLANNRDVPQGEIDPNFDFSYRTVMRELHILEENGLVERYVGSTTGIGKPPNIWNITLLGLFALIGIRYESKKEMSPNLIDEIAAIHSDKWVLFEEWDYISRQKTNGLHMLKGFFSMNLQRWCYFNASKFFAEMEPMLSFGSLLGKYPNIEDIGEIIRLDAFRETIGLDHGLFSYGDSHGIDPNFDVIMSNNNLKDEILKIIKVERDRCRRLKIFEAQFNL